jgi:exopolysaccharide production protein ExoZ
MLFYAAVTAVLFERRLLFVIVGIFAGAVACRTQGPIFQFLGSPLIFEFLFGVALAYMPRWGAAIWCLPIGAAALIIAALLGVPNQELSWDKDFQRLWVYGVLAAMIVLGTMQINAKQSVWTFLGDASYTLYLTHELPLLLLTAWWHAHPVALAHPVAPDLIVVIGSSQSVLFAWRMYVLFEIPMLEWLGRRGRRSSLGSPLGRRASPAGRRPPRAVQPPSLS